MRRIIVLLVVLTMLMAMPATLVAQEPGEGGAIIEGNGGTSVGALNDLRCAGADCRTVTQFLTVPFLGVNPETAFYAPNVETALAIDWTVSEDGKTYTFNLRDDLYWSDGEQVDGWDYQFAYYAYKNADAFESPYGYEVADFENVTVSEDGFTVTVEFSSASCTALGDSVLNMVPSHVFGWTPEIGEDFDWTSLIGHPYETNPNVSGGPFIFQSMDSERVVLVANPNYPRTVVPEGYLYVTVPDQTVMAERFIAGELNVSDNPQQNKWDEIRSDDNLQTFEYTSGLWDYLALNHANPDNPMDGIELDDEGNPVLDENGDYIPVEQDPHPLFGDVRVRQAIQMAIDLDVIMDKAVFGEGTVMTSFVLPGSWALDPNLSPVKPDQEGALALLAEAGWTDSDGNGILDKDGMEFSFELLTNEGNTRRGQITELIQQQLAEIGIEVEIAAIDFNQLLDLTATQTYDAVVLGWQSSYPDDPDEWDGLFNIEQDIVGSGFNDFSYHNPEITRLFIEARNVPGCATEERAQIYYEIQRILAEEQAYIWLFARNGLYAASADIEGWGPAANDMYFGFTPVDAWRITRTQ